MTDPRHLLLVGTGPGLGAAIARRFAGEGYRLTLVARSEETIATIAQELRAAGADVDVVQADAGDPERLRAAHACCSPAVDSPTLLPETLATLSVGKVALRATATMLARQLRDDEIHAFTGPGEFSLATS